MFVTLVHCHVKPEHADAFADACRANHEASTREPGNVRFDVLRLVEDPTHFVLYEWYVDEAAAQAHRTRPTTPLGARPWPTGSWSRATASATRGCAPRRPRRERAGPAARARPAPLAPVPDFALGRIPRITFGAGAFARVPGIVAAHGSRVLLVTGGRSLAASGRRDALLDGLRRGGRHGGRRGGRDRRAQPDGGGLRRGREPGRGGRLEERYHLNEPFLVRYWIWLTAAVRGDLGESIPLRENVSTLIGQRIGVTPQLVLLTAAIIIIVGVGLGHPRARSAAARSTPACCSPRPCRRRCRRSRPRCILQFVFGGRCSAGSRCSAPATASSTRCEHLTLPALALAATSVALVTRVTRTAVREELDKEHVQTAVSRGLPWRQVVRRHVLRNAAIPITTVVGHHHRQPHRARGGRGDRVRPQRARRLPRPGRAEQGLRGRPGHQPRARVRLRHHQRAHRHRLRAARPARRPSGAVPSEHPRSSDPGRRGSRRPSPEPPQRCASSAGSAGSASAVIALGAAPGGPRPAPARRSTPTPATCPSPTSVRSGRTCSASTARAATCCQPAAWSAPARPSSAPRSSRSSPSRSASTLAVATAWFGGRFDTRRLRRHRRRVRVPRHPARGRWPPPSSARRCFSAGLALADRLLAVRRPGAARRRAARSGR